MRERFVGGELEGELLVDEVPGLSTSSEEFPGLSVSCDGGGDIARRTLRPLSRSQLLMRPSRPNNSTKLVTNSRDISSHLLSSS